jgi:hypothetical protein
MATRKYHRRSAGTSLGSYHTASDRSQSDQQNSPRRVLRSDQLSAKRRLKQRDQRPVIAMWAGIFLVLLVIIADQIWGIL